MAAEKVTDSTQGLKWQRQVSVFKEVNKQLRLQLKALRRLKDQDLLQVFENVLDILCKLDMKGFFEYINPAVTRMLGYPVDELLGTSAFAIIHPEDLQKAFPTFQKILSGTRPPRMEVRLMKKDGFYIWYEIRGHAIQSGSKTIGVVLECRDIESRKHAEEQLNRSEARFKLMVDNVSDYLFSHDLDGYFIETNIAAHNAFQQVITANDHLNVRDLMPETMRFQFSDYMNIILNHGKASGLIKVVGRNRQDIILEYTNAMVYDEHRKPLYVQGIARDITERIEHAKEKSRYVKKLEEMARHDALTGLTNRKHLYEKLTYAIDHAQRTGRQGAILFIDLDDFKKVNDTHGHEVGDEILKIVSLRMKTLIRKDDIAARLGGDEFVILLADITESVGTETVAQKVVETITNPLIVKGLSISVGVSVGISIFPDDATDPEMLIRFSDMAMYEAKRKGKNTHKKFRDIVSGD